MSSYEGLSDKAKEFLNLLNSGTLPLEEVRLMAEEIHHERDPHSVRHVVIIYKDSPDHNPEKQDPGTDILWLP